MLAGWEAGDGVTRWPSQIVHAVPLAVGVAAGAARLAAGLAAFAADWGGVHLGESAAGAGAAAGGVQVRAGDALGLVPETLGRGVQVRGDGARQGLVAGVQSEVIREAGFGVARRGGQAGGLSKRP